MAHSVGTPSAGAAWTQTAATTPPGQPLSARCHDATPPRVTPASRRRQVPGIGPQPGPAVAPDPPTLRVNPAGNEPPSIFTRSRGGLVPRRPCVLAQVSQTTPGPPGPTQRGSTPAAAWLTRSTTCFAASRSGLGRARLALGTHMNGTQARSLCRSIRSRGCGARWVPAPPPADWIFIN